MSTPFNFDSDSHFDYIGQQELSVGEAVARYTAGARVPTAEAAMDMPFDFDFHFNLYFDFEMTAGAVGGKTVARYTAGARVPTAEAAMAMPFDFHFNLYFDFEMTAGAVGRRGCGQVHSRSSCTNGGGGDGHAF